MSHPELNPTLEHVSFPTKDPSHFLHLISNLLAPSECDSIIASHTNLVPSNVTSKTIRDRQMFHDSDLSALLWSRIVKFYDGDEIVDEDGQKWKIKGLNDKFRLCRYRAGGKFSPHTDGRRLADLNNQSFMTINMYLNTVPEELRGATRFLSDSTPSLLAANQNLEVLAKAQPLKGQAVVFRDHLWHDGDELVEGEKWLLRTDVMYRREKEFDFLEIYGELGKEEMLEKILNIASMLEDAGNVDEAVEWYRLYQRSGS